MGIGLNDDPDVGDPFVGRRVAGYSIDELHQRAADDRRVGGADPVPAVTSGRLPPSRHADDTTPGRDTLQRFVKEHFSEASLRENPLEKLVSDYFQTLGGFGGYETTRRASVGTNTSGLEGHSLPRSQCTRIPI